jgi:hypothetical protein
VDGAVDPAAAEHLSIGRVDDGVYRLAGEVALENFDSCRHRRSIS